MNSVFAKRRARLLAMKAIRDNHISGEKAVTCPKCGQDSDRKTVAEHLSVCPKCGYHFPIGATTASAPSWTPAPSRSCLPGIRRGTSVLPRYRAKLDAASARPA